MSIGKFVAGTTIAAPAVGGGGYITYRELTKEKTETTEEVVTSDGSRASEGDRQPTQAPAPGVANTPTGSPDPNPTGAGVESDRSK